MTASSSPESGRPESQRPGGLVEVLTRWERSGGQWQVLSSSDGWIDIGLFSCDGLEQMSRVGGARTTVLHAYLAGRESSAGQELRIASCLRVASAPCVRRATV